MSGSTPNPITSRFKAPKSVAHNTRSLHAGYNRQTTLSFILSYFHTLNFKSFNFRQNRSGFTLIEIIVTIVISAVLATILAQVMANQTWRSYVPVQTIEENLALRAIMDNIASDYRLLRRTDASPLVTLQSRIRTDGTYWDASRAYTNGVSLQATTSCIGFDTGNSEDPALENTNCDATDTILKVTLSVTGSQHRLTTLFTR